MSHTQDSDKTQTTALNERSEIMAGEGLNFEQLGRNKKRSWVY